MAQPAVEAPAGAKQAGGAVERGAGCFDEDGARAGVCGGEGGGVVAQAAVPGAGGEHRGRVVCAEAAEAVVRRAPAEATVEERLAGEVDAEGHALAADACDDRDVRVAGLDARAAAEASLHPVTNRVLDAEGDELGVPELVVHAVGIDGKGRG